MNQPDLGLKVTELRQTKGFTQEQLAEKCEVSPRTIQRIESGEVDPRAYTLQCLSEVLDFDFGEENTSKENLWLTTLHLSNIFGMLIIPLLLWSWKKNQSYKIDRQGRLVLNFQLTMTVLLFVALLFVFVILGIVVFLEETRVGASDLVYTGMGLIGILPFLAIGVFCAYQGVINATRALADKPIRYALSIPFVK